MQIGLDVIWSMADRGHHALLVLADAGRFSNPPPGRVARGPAMQFRTFACLVLALPDSLSPAKHTNTALAVDRGPEHTTTTPPRRFRNHTMAPVVRGFWTLNWACTKSGRFPSRAAVRIGRERWARLLPLPFKPAYPSWVAFLAPATAGEIARFLPHRLVKISRCIIDPNCPATYLKNLTKYVLSVTIHNCCALVRTDPLLFLDSSIVPTSSSSLSIHFHS